MGIYEFKLPDIGGASSKARSSSGSSASARASPRTTPFSP